MELANNVLNNPRKEGWSNQLVGMFRLTSEMRWHQTKTLEQTSNDDGEIEQIRKQTWFDCRKGGKTLQERTDELRQNRFTRRSCKTHIKEIQEPSSNHDQRSPWHPAIIPQLCLVHQNESKYKYSTLTAPSRDSQHHPAQKSPDYTTSRIKRGNGNFPVVSRFLHSNLRFVRGFSGWPHLITGG